MKKLFLSFTMIVFTHVLFGQNTFEIKTVGSQYTIEELTLAFNSADFCGSYFSSKRNVITLIDGSIVELKSKNEMINQGISLPESCFLAEGQTFYKCTWSLADNGMLLKGFNTELYGSEKEYQRYNSEEQ